jgi:spermidine synthase
MAKPFAKFFQPRRIPEISVSEEGGIRYLHFGTVWVQGAMRLSAPFHLELDYTRELFAGLLFQPAPRAVTLLGLGAGSASKFAWKSCAKAKITSVELNPAVIALARSQFALPPDSRRMATLCADAQAHVAAHPCSADYVIADVYDAAAKGPVLSSPEFYAACRNALNPDRTCVLAVNLFGRHKSFDTNLRNIAGAFGGRMLVLPPSERGNVIVFAFAGAPLVLPVAELRSRAAELRAATGLEFPRWLGAFRSANALVGNTWTI